MKDADWYTQFSEEVHRRAYKFAYFIWPDNQIVISKIIPNAVSIACGSLRYKQNRRSKYKGSHWKIFFTDQQLLQIGILEAVKENLKSYSSISHTPVHPLTWYIAYLSLCTLSSSNSFDVAVGFGRVLIGLKAQNILDLYGFLDSKRRYESKSVYEKAKVIQKQLYKEFEHIYQTSSERLHLSPIEKRYPDNIFRILEELRLWETKCLQINNMKVNNSETSIPHIFMDHYLCLKHLIDSDRRFSGCKGRFDYWRLPHMKDMKIEQDKSGNPPNPPNGWEKINKEILKEILYNDYEKNNKKNNREPIFKVIVDGKQEGFIGRGGRRSIIINLTSLARYLEVKNEAGVMVANCHLMDPDALPRDGWKSAVTLPSGKKLFFKFLPTKRPEQRETSMSVEIGISSRWAWSIPRSIALAQAWSTFLSGWERLNPAVQAKRIFAFVLAIALLGPYLLLEQYERKLERIQDRVHLEMQAAIEEVHGVAQLLSEQSTQDELRKQVRTTLYEGFRDTARLLGLLAKANPEEIAEAVQQIQVAQARTPGKTYPYPTWRYMPAHLTVISEGVMQSPDLKVEYEDYLRQWARIFLNLGNVLVQTPGKIVEATRVFEYLREAQPDDKGLLFALGELYKMADDHDKAVKVYEDMIARGLAEQDPRPAHYAGWSFYKLGNYDTALRCYDDALRIDPRYAKVFYNKALIFRDLGHQELYQENLERALELTLYAYQREGNENPRIPFTLGILYATKGDFDRALAYLELTLQKEQLYIVRAEKEPAFEVFRNGTDQSYYQKFQNLLGRYRPTPQGEFGIGSQETYNFSEFQE